MALYGPHGNRFSHFSLLRYIDTELLRRNAENCGNLEIGFFKILDTQDGISSINPFQHDIKLWS